jgi:succinate dehydrogenase / fumarate reductase flavoprotein subunit
MQKGKQDNNCFRSLLSNEPSDRSWKNKMHHRHEMLDLVIVDGKARGIIARNLVTGEIERHSAHAVVIASGGYGNVFSCQLMQWEVTLRQLENTQKELLQILVTQIHPTCIPEIINPN